MIPLCRVQVLNDDEGQAAAFRYVLQELIEGFQPAGRSADAYNGEACLWSDIRVCSCQGLQRRRGRLRGC